MERYKRDKLAALAIAGLRATPNEKWSYIFDGPDCIAISFCDWEEVSEYWGTTEALNLDWDLKRRALIDAGAAEPTTSEFRQWQKAMAQRLADNGEASIAWIRRIEFGTESGSVALFIAHSDSGPEDEPRLLDVFESADDAFAALGALGVIAESSIKHFGAWK